MRHLGLPSTGGHRVRAGRLRHLAQHRIRRLSHITLIGLAGWLCASLPLQAGTWTDIEILKKELQRTGTSTIEAKCNEKGVLSFYEYEKDKKDQITICINNIAKDDPDAYWEALAHEATHVMQACANGNAVNDDHIARIYRELQSINPTSVEDIQEYGSWNKRQEIEARWMELQQPGFTIEMLKELCKNIRP